MNNDRTTDVGAAAGMSTGIVARSEDVLESLDIATPGEAQMPAQPPLATRTDWTLLDKIEAAAMVVDEALRDRDDEPQRLFACLPSWRTLRDHAPHHFDAYLARLRQSERAVLLRRLDTPKRETPPQFGFVTVGELLRMPMTPWRVLRVIPSRGLIVVWGASGSGKTFVVLDMSAAIARGMPWGGRRTKRGAVAYIAAEGQLRDRVDAYLQRNGLPESELFGLRVLDSAVNLVDPTADIGPLIASLRALADETGGLAAVVIDTLNRVMPGGDENSSEDMGMVIAAAKRIESEIGCAVIFIHHSGKDESRGSRGHSSLKAAADAEISVRRNGEIRTVTAEKVRDGADGEILMTFRLATVDLGPMTDFDPDAEPDERRSSCVVEPSEAVQLPANTRLSDTDELALRVLREMCAETADRTEATSLHPAGRPRVAIDDWRERFRRKRGVDMSDAKAREASLKAFQRAVDKLNRLRTVGVYEKRVWLW